MAIFKLEKIKMKSRIFTILLSILILFARPVFSQGNVEDQYRQMGGVVGLTELCFGTKNLEIALFEQVGTVFYNNPEMGRLMFELLFVYFDSYEVAKNEQVIWNGTQQAYNNNSFDCSEENKTLIKTFEEQLIAGLQQEQ